RASDGDVPDLGLVVAADVCDGDGGAGGERAGADADRVRLDRAVSVRYDVHAAGLGDGGEVVDVRPLAAAVVDDGDLGADGNEAARAGQADPGEVLLHVRVDAHDIAGAATSGDGGARPDLSFGGALNIHDQDRDADPDEPASDGARETDDREVVVGANADAVPGDDRPVDRRERAGVYLGRGDRAARDVAWGRSRGDGRRRRRHAAGGAAAQRVV